MYDYCTICKNSKDKVSIRKVLVEYALLNGIKATAEKYLTTPKTVRKWVKRWRENHSNESLKDLSRKPLSSPNKMLSEWIDKIKEIAFIATKDNKRINASMIKEKYKIPYSIKTIAKYLKKYYKLRSKKTKKEKKRDMREIKNKYKAFEKIQVDIKYLDDIPEFYRDYKKFNLPRYQITARCVKSGALFISYSHEKTVTATSIFIHKLLLHLQKNGVDISKSSIQTDNGTEFTSTWNSLKKTLFSKIIEKIFKSKHYTIPPGAKTYQSDVETSHRIIEDEFYACEYFYSKEDFFLKAKNYQNHFNYNRFNKYSLNLF